MTPIDLAPKRELAADVDFWGLIASNKAGLSNPEWTKFIKAMQESHLQMLYIMNLEDLEHLATEQAK